MKNLYLNNRFFYTLIGIGVLYGISFFFPKLIWGAHTIFFVLIIAGLIELFLLFTEKKGVLAQRILPEKMSNGDTNQVTIDVKNLYSFKTYIKVIDEIPFQFQIRDFQIHKEIKAGTNIAFYYSLIPKERGEYSFGNLNVYVTSILGFVSKRYCFQKDEIIRQIVESIEIPR